MAAYASLVSVMQIIDQLERHPSPPITLEKQQVESLTQIISFLQEFLEGYESPFAYSDEADPLEMRIADAAYAAEDVIESHIVDVIKLDRSTSTHHPSWSRFINSCRGPNKAAAVPLETRLNNLYKNLHEVIEEMDSIKKVVAEMMMTEHNATRPRQQQRNVIRSSSLTGKNTTFMVGLDDVLNQLLDKLTGGPRCRQVIPITGMGGIGKTTLARNIFAHGLIKDHFDVCAWVTVSQQYNTREIICQILSQLINGHMSGKKSEEVLGEELHKYLFNRRYLIIMDDIWDIDVWEKINLFLADCHDIGSRIIVTTRLSNLTSQLTNSYALGMKFLDEARSWNLFFKTVCGEKRAFPLELEEIGKKIVKHCRGLPLSIVVIGGLLAKSQHTQEHWKHIEQKLNSIVNSENDEYCLKILKLSYNNLSAYLKPCFLYMGIFEEDTSIRVSNLIRLWVSEGILKPEGDKNMEAIGREFLMDLIDRNLILVDKLGCTGHIKYCKVHDLLRDLCLKEGQKERFYHVIGKHISQQGIHNPRRLLYSQRSFNERVVDALKSMFYLRRNSNERVESMPNVRSLTSHHYRVGGCQKFRLLRILNAYDMYGKDHPKYSFNSVIHELVNSRYLAFAVTHRNIKLTSSLSFFWNLHTLRLERGGKIVLPVEIWKMSQLRHVYSNFETYLSDPPSCNKESRVVLENLETLKTIENFKCGEEVVYMIPNIKKLAISYDKIPVSGTNDDCYYLRNVERLCKLESFTMITPGSSMQHLTFPNSLIKLTLGSRGDSVFGWEEMFEKIGSSLPLLQKLELSFGRFTTSKWETIEGHFPNLIFLKLLFCNGLKEWIIEESSHFPCLEKLQLFGLDQLEEIPSEIGNIPTLQSIYLGYSCSESAVKSAKKIVVEQEELQGEQPSFHVDVLLWDKEHESLLSLACPNFNIKLV